MTSLTSSAQKPSLLTIDLGALSRNFKTLTSRTKATVGAAVKADGYGIGARQAAEILHHAGCRNFFVATPDEAEEILSIPKMNEARIFVLGGLYKGAEDFYTAKGILPVLNSLDDIARWTTQTKKSGSPLPCAVHVDTGMNRLGLKIGDVPETFADLNIALLMSHFACADEKDHPLNAQQAQRFSALAQRFPNVPKSLCNSSGIFRNSDWHYDVVRPGYALYGGNPTPETTNPMESVVTLFAQILQVRSVKKGESAGYGAGHVFENDTITATVAIGYADGLPRSGSAKVTFFYDGQPCPVLGRISMDTTIVDIGAIMRKPNQGDFIEILGPHQDVDALATACGTIGYEILTSLGTRHERLYKK